MSTSKTHRLAPPIPTSRSLGLCGSFLEPTCFKYTGEEQSNCATVFFMPEYIHCRANSNSCIVLSRKELEEIGIVYPLGPLSQKPSLTTFKEKTAHFSITINYHTVISSTRSDTPTISKSLSDITTILRYCKPISAVHILPGHQHPPTQPWCCW